MSHAWKEPGEQEAEGSLEVLITEISTLENTSEELHKINTLLQ